MMKSRKLTHLFGILALLLLMPGLSFAQNLRVEGNSNVGYRLEGVTYAANQSTREWYVK